MKLRAGDVIEYSGCAIMLLGDPVERNDHPQHRWHAPAVYLYLPSEHDFRNAGTKEGTAFPIFTIHDETTLWPEPLTDEQEATAMRFLLVGSFAR